MTCINLIVGKWQHCARLGLRRRGFIHGRFANDCFSENDQRHAGHVLGSDELANELRAQVKATAGLEMKIAVPIGGKPSRVAFMSTHENLAEFDTLTKKLLTDQEYQELLKKGAGIVVPDTQFDELWFTL